MSTRHWALVLAIGATSTALCLSVLAGWQRGGSLPERLVWVAIGLVLVTSAHLLPALLRDAPILVRAIGGVLWAACLATACIGHAVFFVMAQQHAGELRMSAVPAAPVSTSSRSLTAIMADRATVTAQLAAAKARYCAGNCVTLEARRVTLAAKVDALNAEADDIQRQQAADDRVTARRDALRADPVTSRLATLLGVPVARIDLLLGSMFAAVLEGVACLLWTMALRSSSLPFLTGVTTPAVATVTDSVVATPSTVTAVANTTTETQPVVTPVTMRYAAETVGRETVTTSHDDMIRSRSPRDDPIMPQSASDPIDDHLTQLARDITAGLVRPTVADIRRHLGCSQAKAVTLRRQLAESHSAA
ncbi:hypothetical protein WJ32_02365 [Burkholderia ubonensis]|uniref:Uncharacterized protein n=1 Tax=Burkholderia ubonensis TaxID=101571 RepID=A0A124RA48_9BURK|nr:hypothetical protein [Burkholderia ubonensis]AOJ61409.1 hypothetical protein WJ32_02365 [Burkholderia ubonensis]KVG63456.1 hypothetical protein WJ33_03505 [Burkholderia ubonensis]